MKLSDLLKPKIAGFLLLLLVSYHLITNLIWIFLSTAPLPWDQAGHTRLAIQFADYFTSLGFLRIVDYFSISSYYPPLIHTMVGLLTIALGHPVQIGALVITLFFLTSIILVYVFAFELFKRTSVAIISAFIYSFYPIVFEHSRWLLLEIPLLCFLLATLICLFRSEIFQNSKYTKLFFIFAAFALLTKWLTLVYIFFPFLLIFIKWLKLKDKKQVDNFIKSASIFVFVTSPWYLLNLSNFLNQALPNLKGESSDPQSILSLQNFIFYIYLFINFQTGLFMAILFIISLIVYLFRSRLNHKLLIGGYFLFIYILFTAISNKDWRYTMPILPFAAIVTGLFLTKIKDKFKLVGSITIVSIFFSLTTYHLLLTFRPPNFHLQRAIKIPVIGWLDYFNINDNLAHTYNNKVYPQKEILLSIDTNTKTYVLSLVDQERFNAGNLLLERDLLKLSNIEVESPPANSFKSNEDLRNFLTKYSYVLTADKDYTNPATRNAYVFMQINNFILNVNRDFTKQKDYTLPNGIIINLYKKYY